jgi:hypothetical protein
MMTGDSHVSLVNVALTFAIASGMLEFTCTLHLKTV